jgi:hypothetical protein
LFTLISAGNYRRPGQAAENLIAGPAVETHQAQQRHQGGQLLAVHAGVGQAVMVGRLKGYR